MGDRPDMPDEVSEVVERLIELLGDDLKAVLWQGSWARGEAKPWSDHDLMIVMKRLDDDLLRRLQEIFRGRKDWSTFVRTEEELRQYPSEGRPQWHFGLVPLYGKITPPPLGREQIVDELRMLALNISFECRYRLLHREPVYTDMDTAFQRARNARVLRYTAKLAILAMKARELFEGREYPVSSADLRPRLSARDELWVVDMVDGWDSARESIEGDAGPAWLRLDAFARKLVAWLDELEGA